MTPDSPSGRGSGWASAGQPLDEEPRAEEPGGDARHPEGDGAGREVEAARAEDQQIERHQAEREEEQGEAGDPQGGAAGGVGRRPAFQQRGAPGPALAEQHEEPEHQRARGGERGERGAEDALGEDEPVGDGLLGKGVVAGERAREDELDEAAEVDAQRAGDAVGLVGVDERVVERVLGQRRWWNHTRNSCERRVMRGASSYGASSSSLGSGEGNQRLRSST